MKKNFKNKQMKVQGWVALVLLSVASFFKATAAGCIIAIIESIYFNHFHVERGHTILGILAMV